MLDEQQSAAITDDDGIREAWPSSSSGPHRDVVDTQAVGMLLWLLLLLLLLLLLQSSHLSITGEDVISSHDQSQNR